MWKREKPGLIWTEFLSRVSVSVFIFNHIPYGLILPSFATILIISLCCVVIVTMAYIMLCQKTTQQGEGRIWLVGFWSFILSGGIFAYPVHETLCKTL
jgi:hypothetical protein